MKQNPEGKIKIFLWNAGRKLNQYEFFEFADLIVIPVLL